MIRALNGPINASIPPLVTGLTGFGPWQDATIVESNSKEITMHFTRNILMAALGAVCLMAPAWAASGTMSATPNPCRIQPGEHECTTFVAWSTEGTRHAKVFVRSEGRKVSAEKEFVDGANCVPMKCRAGWIEADTNYVFTLYRYEHGERGEVLGSVVVTATR